MRHSPAPRFLKTLTFHGLRGTPVAHVHRIAHRLRPKFMAEALGMNHGPCHLHDGAIGPFGHPVLLRRVRYGILPCNAMFAQKIIKCLINVFPTIILPKDFHNVLGLPLHQGFPFFKSCQHLTLGFEHIHPNLTRKIVNEGEKIPCASDGRRFHRPSHVGMHELQDLLWTSVCFRGKRTPCLLASLFALHASFAYERMYVVRHHLHVHAA